MREGLWVPQYNFGSQVSEVGSSLPPCGSWELSSGLQSWWQGLYPLSPLIWHFVSFSFSLSPHIYYPPLAPDLLLYSFPVFWLRSSVEWILLPQKSDCTAALTNSALTGTHTPTHSQWDLTLCTSLLPSFNKCSLNTNHVSITGLGNGTTENKVKVSLFSSPKRQKWNHTHKCLGLQLHPVQLGHPIQNLNSKVLQNRKLDINMKPQVKNSMPDLWQIYQSTDALKILGRITFSL